MAILREIAAVRENAGFWARDTHTIIRFHGEDALSWLHSQTTNDVKGLASGRGNIQALLDRTGRIQCCFHLFRWNEEAWAVIARDQAAALAARMETHLFLEDVQCEDVGGTGLQVCVEGPRALVWLSRLLREGGQADRDLPRLPHAVSPLLLAGHEILAFSLTESGEDGCLLVPGPDDGEAFLNALRDHAPEYGIAEIGAAGRRALRLESGLPDFPEEIDPTIVISETPYEQCAVSYDKGCYLGQEVVARVRAYGSPKLALSGLVVLGDDDHLPHSLPTELRVAGKKAGTLRSLGYAPTLGAWAGRAYLSRDMRVPGQAHRFETEDGHIFEARVEALPLHDPKDRSEVVRAMYEAALAAFEDDVDDERDEAIAMLEDVLALDPAFEDAYEALGVILHRHHRVDEAIAVMQQLAVLNPHSVMAHTNLSVFYVAKGMIPEAEAEKAIAHQLETRHSLNEKEARAQAEAERARIRRDAEERIAMFEEVLSFDPDDPVATMGLGSAWLQLEQYGNAVPWFEKAVSLKKDYSAAYLNLGKCLEFLGRTAEARAAYGSGIEAASRKGDLMPLREMERRLKALEDTART